MRILYITQWFEPEPAFKGLSFAKALAARGHQVEVVTGFPNYPTGKLYPGYKISLHKREEIDGITVHRVALYPSHDDSSIRRIANYLSFSATSALLVLRIARQFDVICAYSPVTIGLGAVVGAFFSGKPVITEVQDLWPDSVLKSGMRGTIYMRPVLDALCRLVYWRSKKIIAQSKGIREKLIQRGVPPQKITVVYNWADEEAAVAKGTCDLAPYRFEGRFNIVYGGNLGKVQGLETLVRAAILAAREVHHLHLLLIGGGTEYLRIEALARELNAANVTVAPSVPSSQIGDIFSAADVLVLHLIDDPLFAITIPSKTQFYMAMGKPILIGVEGEAARLVADAGAGIAVPPDDVEAMAKAMVQFAKMPNIQLKEMAERSRGAYQKNFSLSRALSAIDAVVSQVAHASKSS